MLKKLTKGEQDHLTTLGIRNIKEIKLQVAFMKKENPNDPGNLCRECWHIARKLKLI